MHSPSLCPPTSSLFPYTTLFRSRHLLHVQRKVDRAHDPIPEHLVGHVPERVAVNSDDLHEPVLEGVRRNRKLRADRDRKSTRLNSSHTVISYAVFCLKKKNKKTA